MRMLYDIELKWPDAPEAMAYRLLLRDDTEESLILKVQTAEPCYSICADIIDPSHRYQWSIQFRKQDSAQWLTLFPYLRLLLPIIEKKNITYIDWTDQGDPAYRVLIHDDAFGQIIVKDGVIGTRYAVDWTTLDASHPYRYRIQPYRDGRWVDDMPYRSLNPPIELISLKEAERRTDYDPASKASKKLFFLLTIDTEVNLRYMRHPDPARGLEHQIFCVQDGKHYGINYIMDRLDHYNFKGTFFLDILLEYQFGPGALIPVVEAIKERNHDIQLHLHTAPHLRFASESKVRELASAITRNEPDRFRRALGLAIELFEKRVGRRPVAFRSGAYHMCDAFFPVLAEFDIKIDSSLYAFKNCRVSPWMRARTQPFWVNNVLEIPVSWMIYRGKTDRVRQFLAGKSDAGQQPAIRSLATIDGFPSATLVYMLHSYSLLTEHRPTDDRSRQEWNELFKTCCTDEEYRVSHIAHDKPVVFLEGPDEDRINIFERALATVAAQPNAAAISLQELHDEYLTSWAVRSSPTDPVALWDEHTKRLSLTGTRYYSRSLLEHVEASFDRADDAAGVSA